jgi:cysteinyl-tRNA synthetase
VFGLKMSEFQPEAIPQEILKLAEERLLAKNNGDFSTSDILRDKIHAEGYIIEDIPNSYKLKKRG